MPLRLIVFALAAVVSVTALAASDPGVVTVDSEWSRVIARAAAEEKPIVAFNHFQECPAWTPCGAFLTLVAHPVNQRRLAGVIFATRPFGEGEEDSSISVHRPDGTSLIRWMGIPDAAKFARILTGLEEATAHIVAAHRSSSGGRDSEATRESVLALLAFGYELKARPILEAMRDAGTAENRQLGTLWLDRLDALRSNRLPDEDLLATLARDGVTDRVGFEAWMATGDVRFVTRRIDEAVIAYDKAAELSASNSSQRQIALESRQRAEHLILPILGLGSPGAVVTGRRTIWPRLLPKDVARVEYRLDGDLVAAAKKTPFATSVNFGRLPKRHVLKMTALDRRGVLLHETSVVVNDRGDAFSVEIVEPSGTALSGVTDVVVAVKVPHGRHVEGVAVDWNDRRVARLTSPPYQARVIVKSGEQGVLRATARLQDGSELEDVRLVNSEGMTLESDVHLVEIPAYAEGGTVVTRETVTIKEDGSARKVDRVIPASDTPLLVALLIDASWSMTENMLDVQEAAIRFVERNIADDDRVMVIGFDTEVRILWPTRERDLVQRAILSIQARGLTSLNDAMITALLQLQSPGWRRALVVFSDGLDNRSTFSAGDVTEVARRSGVPIYVLSLRPAPPTGVPGLAMRSARSVFTARTELMRIGWSTGGKAYDMRSLEKLESIWNEIGQDLQKQFLVVYRPAPGGEEWRSIEVFDGRKRLRAPSGLAVAPERPAEEP